MKILIACSSYYPYVKGGGEVSTKLLAEALLRAGHEVYVASMADEDDFELVDGISVFRIKHKNIYWSYKKDVQSRTRKFLWHMLNMHNARAASKIVRLAKSLSVSHVLTSTVEDISTAVWSASRRAGFSVVHVLRSYNLKCSRATMFKNGENCSSQCASCRVATYPMKIDSQYVTHVVGISDFILREHVSSGYFKNSKKSIIFNISQSSIVRKSSSKSVWSPRLGKKIKIGFIGNLLPTKGIEIIFSALKRIPEYASRFEVLVAGDGAHAYVESLRVKGELSGARVDFVGHVDAGKFYPRIDWLIVPSIWNEPFGRVIVEAFEFERPVMAMKRGGIPELVGESNGLLFRDEADLSNRLIDICEKTFNFDFSSTENFRSERILRKWEEVFAKEQEISHC